MEQLAALKVDYSHVLGGKGISTSQGYSRRRVSTLIRPGIRENNGLYQKKTLQDPWVHKGEMDQLRRSHTVSKANDWLRKTVSEMVDQ